MFLIKIRYSVCVAFAIIFILGLCSASFCETPQQVINPKKTNNNWVSDMAGVISDEDKTQINSLIGQLEKKTSAEIAVVTVKSVGDTTPKDFAVELLNLWGVGKKGKDNGVLVLLAMDIRRIEIETGYGTEGVLTDGKVGEILDAYVIPKFKEGSFGKGVLAGVQAMVKAMENDKTDTFQPSPSTIPPEVNQPITPQIQQKPPKSWIAVFIQTAIIFVVLALIAFVPIILIWRHFVRYCKKCGKKMRRLSEQEDDAYLSFDQKIEEGLGSVNYHVWRCDNCQTTEIKRSVRYMSGYEDCPKCKHRTLYVDSHTVQEPTYEREGLEEITKVCRYPKCGYKDTNQRNIPRRQRQSVALPLILTTIAASRETSRGSGFGGFSGGSSGGSFGGGSSGGGGAGRSW